MNDEVEADAIKARVEQWHHHVSRRSPNGVEMASTPNGDAAAGDAPGAASEGPRPALDSSSGTPMDDPRRAVVFEQSGPRARRPEAKQRRNGAQRERHVPDPYVGAPAGSAYQDEAKRPWYRRIRRSDIMLWALMGLLAAGISVILTRSIP